jgi:ComF family protein
LINHLIDILYPQTCLGCDELLVMGEEVLCTICRHELPLTNHHLLLENDSYKRLAGRVPLELVMSMLVFEKHGLVQEIIHKLKYDGHEEVGVLLGDWYAELIKDKLNDVDIILPVPLHPKRLKERGYNQVTTFCKSLSNRLQIELNEELLVRKIYAKTQTKKSLSSRTEVTKDIFDVVYTSEHQNKHFLIVDDVLTTGTTLEQCAKAVLKIPGSKVSIMTMAITY